MNNADLRLDLSQAPALKPETHKKLAESLDQAEQSLQQVPLLTEMQPNMNIGDSYAVQRAWSAMKIARGCQVKGWKIGLTSKAMQAALGITTPDSGVLFDDMFFDDGGTVPKGRFIQPRIEAEIAFYMAHDLEGPDVSAIDVLNATDFISPSLEILDTRIVRKSAQTGKARTVIDTIADNAANAGLVLGGRPVKTDALYLRWAGAAVAKNGAIEETGLGAGVLNSPALSVAWLAQRLALTGEKISAGQVILSGSFIRPIETEPGDTISADFGSLGNVAVYFADDKAR